MKETQEKWKRKKSQDIRGKEMRKEENSQNNRKEQGITLIALVVTIVVLLILAGITINMLFSNGGIFKTAQDAANAWNEATINEQESINNIAEQIGNLVNGQVDGGDAPEKPENPPKGPNGKPLVETATEIQTESNLEAEDKYGNPVIVPKGFKVVVDETTKNATTVPEGIVIEDFNRNQFVWIPTGTYKINESGTTKTNDLTRRQWGTIVNTVQEPTPIIGDEVASGINGAVYYGEGDSRSVAHDTIANFLNSAKPVVEGGNGGFYIGRYEAGTEIKRTPSDKELTIPLVQANKNAYVYITRDEAIKQAEAMYTNKEQYGVTSELISSYAWDTALNFICQNSENGYKLATTTESIYGNIGTKSEKQTGITPEDCYSNIYDILGNYHEWTTEYSSHTNEGRDYSYVHRGGNYLDSFTYATYRYYSIVDRFSYRHFFPPQLVYIGPDEK
mgnify:CR=1 FL=1